MTASHEGDRPLALGELAQTESPEIVRAALGRFRRRLLLRVLILAMIVAAGFVLYPRYFAVHGDLIHDIRHARGVAVEQTITLGGVDAAVLEVVRLGKADSQPTGRYGVHVRIDDRTIGNDERLVAELYPNPETGFPSETLHGVLELVVSTGGATGHALDIWMSLIPGTRTVDVPLVVVVPGNPKKAPRPVGTIHLDMQQLNVPDWIWR